MSETEPGRKRDGFTLFLVVACLALAVLVVLLARENRSLKQEISRAAEAGAGIKEGESVASFSVASPEGTPETVALDGSGPRVLVLVFTSTCPHCEKTLPIWKEILAAVPPGLRVVGLQLDAATAGGQSLATAGLPFPVYAPGSPGPEFLKRLPGVPSALLLRPDGKVEHAWYGAPSDEQRKELESAVRG